MNMHTYWENKPGIQIQCQSDVYLSDSIAGIIVRFEEEFSEL